MKKKHPMIACTASEFKEKTLGPIGTPKRDHFEKELSEEVAAEQAKREALRKAAEPLIKYLCENHHPHVKAIVTACSVELLEGLISIEDIDDFLFD